LLGAQAQKKNKSWTRYLSYDRCVTGLGSGTGVYDERQTSSLCSVFYAETVALDRVNPLLVKTLSSPGVNLKSLVIPFELAEVNPTVNGVNV